jgi:hypothetical protein
MPKGKFKPGIPEGFQLNVEPVSDLGDYLDEAPALTLRKKESLPPSVVESVTQRGGLQVESTLQSTIPVTDSSKVIEIPTSPKSSPAMVKPLVEEETRAQDETNRIEPRPIQKAPRREISMSPETFEMFDELLELVQQGTGQRDTKANELFHALVLMAHESKGELELYGVPKRGKWGTPTARAFPIELKNAFLSALRRHLQKMDGVGEGLHLQEFAVGQ